MMELPMTMNGRSVSCVVQYVIFPPHSSAGSSNMSTWSEEDNFDTGIQTLFFRPIQLQ